jgi:hypothetical protein
VRRTDAAGAVALQLGRSRGGGRKEGEGVEVDRWGRFGSETKEKKKRSREHGRSGEEAGGPRARRGRKVSFFFFSFSFSNSFQNNF